MKQLVVRIEKELWLELASYCLNVERPIKSVVAEAITIYLNERIKK